MNQIIAQFDLQTSFFLNSLDNILEEESTFQYKENLNPIKWIAGHIVNARMSLISIINGENQNELYQKYFGKGTTNQLNEEAPTIESIKETWLSISEELIDILRNLDEDKLKSSPPFQTSIPDPTLLGLIAYFAIHEAHHIGQISVLRKLIDKTPMKMSRIKLIGLIKRQPPTANASGCSVLL